MTGKLTNPSLIREQQKNSSIQYVSSTEENYLQTLLFYLFELKRFFPRIIMEGSKWCDRMRIYVDFRAMPFACRLMR